MMKLLFFLLPTRDKQPFRTAFSFKLKVFIASVRLCHRSIGKYRSNTIIWGGRKHSSTKWDISAIKNQTLKSLFKFVSKKHTQKKGVNTPRKKVAKQIISWIFAL